MSISSIFGSLFGVFRRKPAVAARTTYRKRTNPKYPWLERELANITTTGHYIVVVPQELALSSAQSIICGRLSGMFGPGTYKTKQIKPMNAVRVIIH